MLLFEFSIPKMYLFELFPPKTGERARINGQVYRWTGKTWVLQNKRNNRTVVAPSNIQQTLNRRFQELPANSQEAESPKTTAVPPPPKSTEAPAKSEDENDNDAFAYFNGLPPAEKAKLYVKLPPKLKIYLQAKLNAEQKHALYSALPSEGRKAYEEVERQIQKEGRMAANSAELRKKFRAIIPILIKDLALTPFTSIVNSVGNFYNRLRRKPSSRMTTPSYSHYITNLTSPVTNVFGGHGKNTDEYDYDGPEEKEIEKILEANFPIHMSRGDSKNYGVYPQQFVVAKKYAYKAYEAAKSGTQLGTEDILRQLQKIKNSPIEGVKNRAWINKMVNALYEISQIGARHGGKVEPAKENTEHQTAQNDTTEHK